MRRIIDEPVFRTRTGALVWIVGISVIIVFLALVFLGMEITGILLYGGMLSIGLCAFCYDSFVITVYEDHFEVRWLFRFSKMRFDHKDIREVVYIVGEIDILRESKRPDYLVIKGAGQEWNLKMGHFMQPINHRNDARAAMKLINERIKSTHKK